MRMRRKKHLEERLENVSEYLLVADKKAMNVQQALKDKIKYNGMTVGRIGKIASFIQPDYSYIKAQLIRLEGIDEDTQYLNEIANEINKGVFIK